MPLQMFQFLHCIVRRKEHIWDKILARLKLTLDLSYPLAKFPLLFFSKWNSFSIQLWNIFKISLYLVYINFLYFDILYTDMFTFLFDDGFASVICLIIWTWLEIFHFPALFQTLTLTLETHQIIIWRCRAAQY